MSNLVQKYNKPTPRYTSYPTVPNWDNAIDQKSWSLLVQEEFNLTNHKEGISLYIHLPFCESLCTYCGCNTRITVNHEVEQPYIKALLKEFDLYLAIFGSKPRLAELHLGGGTPTFFHHNQLANLLNSIFEKVTVLENANLSFEAHPANTTEEHLKMFRSFGFNRLSLGIQDFDPIVQLLINRKQSFEDVQNVMIKARELGFESINFDLIYGLPKQSLEGIKNTVQQVIQLKPDRIAFYSYAHVPWLKPGQRKYSEIDLPKDEEKRELYETGKAMLENAGFIEIGFDHFSLANDALNIAKADKTLHRNFMGYTERKTGLLVGLGVSSISDSWTSFIQNEKKLEDYYKRIELNEFPITKSHYLSKEDEKRKSIILSLMCQQEVILSSDNCTNDFFMELQENAIDLINDGLIYFDKNKLKVTHAGIPFLRVICTLFDTYLDKDEGIQRYSLTI